MKEIRVEKGGKKKTDRVEEGEERGEKEGTKTTEEDDGSVRKI